MLLASLAISVLVQGGFQGADYASTKAALSHGGTIEGNPLMAGKGLAAKKLGIGLILALGDHAVEKSYGKKVWIIRGIEAVGYGLIVRHNMRIR